jgi:DNA-binding response OmpR family regulator
MSRVLVVEDDPDIAELIVMSLVREGHDASAIVNGAEAIASVRSGPPDLVVLDRMLPGMDGLEVCRRLRADRTTAAVPVIMVTARAEEADRIAGLELGADDYVTKPFSPRELMARVKALLRRARQEPAAGPVLRYADLAMDLERHVVRSAGNDVTLTAKEFLLLKYLLEHPGRVLSRDLLLSDVWGYSYTGGTRTVDVHVRRLREKIPAIAAHLVTIKQFGYKLNDLRPAATE